MFISKKRLERILEEERRKAENKVWQECGRQREQERIDKRFDDLESRIWKLEAERNGTKIAVGKK